MSNDKMKSFKAWKNYELPPLNSDGQFASDWIHREWVAFQAGWQAALSSQETPVQVSPQEELTRLESENYRLAMANNILSAKNEALKERLKVAEKLSDNSMASVRKLMQTASDNGAKYAAMNSENEALKLRVAELDHDLKKSEFTCIKLDMEKNEVAEERDRLQSELFYVTRDFNELKRSL